MKLIIQIPCYNEEVTLRDTVRDLPKEIPGVDCVEYIVIDDGSTDRTVEVAEEAGVHHVLRLGTNHGLAGAFKKGIEYALNKGADIVVNTDADNQYQGADIPLLIKPILENKADMVVGCRPIVDHPEFSGFKKAMQKLGSWTLRQVSRTSIPDAASGFRAFSHETCLRLYVYSDFSYCMETLIQAGAIGLRVTSVNIRVNPSTRPSRLFRSMFEYVYRSGTTIMTMFMLYRPGRFFFIIGSMFLGLALFLGLRFLTLVYVLPEDDPTRTYLPSLILLAISTLIGFLIYILGTLGELIKYQRKLQEEVLYRLRREQSYKYDQRNKP